MKKHYIISGIIYLILVFSIVYQRKHHNDRLQFMANGLYYTGCVTGLDLTLYNLVEYTPSDAICKHLSSTADYNEIIKNIDAIKRQKERQKRAK